MSLALRPGAAGPRFRFVLRPLRVPASPDGLFAAGSVIRRVYGEPACLLGAGTALLLQLAHPSVAQGVAEHSDFEHRPLDRLLGTLYATNAVVFGSRRDADRIGRLVGGMHRQVRGEGYDARDPALVAWVNATLVATAVQLHQRVVGPLERDELDELAADAAVVAEVFGCPRDRAPRSWSAFEDYWRDCVDRLDVTDTARRVAGSLFSGRGMPARPVWLPSLAAARAVAAATLPPSVRDGYGLAWGRRERALATGVLTTSAAVLPRVPAPVRRALPELLADPGGAAPGSVRG